MNRVELVYFKDEFLCYSDIVGETAFLHLDLFNWSPSIYKRMLITLDELKEILPEYGISTLMIFIRPDPELLKFETKLGFEYLYGNKEFCLMYQECYNDP